jgi:hypothetical protein
VQNIEATVREDDSFALSFRLGSRALEFIEAL